MLSYLQAVGEESVRGGGQAAGEENAGVCVDKLVGVLLLEHGRFVARGGAQGEKLEKVQAKGGKGGRRASRFS